MRINIQSLMNESGVKFGTSGARGLAVDMTDYVCYAYTLGFLQHLETTEGLTKGIQVAIAGDLRPSTITIMNAVRRAAADMGYSPLMCGTVPSPAVALYGLAHQIPAIMVTGSHIPADRNGIKFNKPTGEILKADEESIRRQTVDIPDALVDENQVFSDGETIEAATSRVAGQMYLQRYLDFFPSDCLAGLNIGVYQHSAVGRKLLVDIYRGLGADVTPLGWSDTFVPVDTEAIRPEDAALAAGWATENKFDTIVSTDGDSDRPLISDENGHWLRGDVAGILCAKYLGADSVSTPVSCNSAVDKCGAFKEVRRTKIGSPFVIASMIEASEAGAKMAVGYEANGGFLTNSDFEANGKTLRALPTRDAAILHIAILLLSKQEGKSIAELVSDLPARYTASDRLQEFPQESSKLILDTFNTGNEAADFAALTNAFGHLCGTVTSIDRTDGVRVTFDNDEVLHMRPSGNAPEFRCYNEASSESRVTELNHACMQVLETLK